MRKMEIRQKLFELNLGSREKSVEAAIAAYGRTILASFACNSTTMVWVELLTVGNEMNISGSVKPNSDFSASIKSVDTKS
jgi:hypothetical protein